MFSAKTGKKILDFRNQHNDIVVLWPPLTAAEIFLPAFTGSTGLNWAITLEALRIGGDYWLA